RGWAGRMYVVVTGGAAAGHAHVGEHRPRPAERRMAGVAFEVGDDVRRPLALRHRPVVAGRAAAARLGVVEVDGRIPGDRGVAGAALIGRENVAGRLRRPAYQAADALAGATVLRRALEHGVDVTGLGGEVAVLTRELKAGGQMVEIRLGGRREGRWREREREQQRRRKRVHASPNALPQDKVLRHVGRHPHWFPPTLAPYAPRLTSDRRARTARYQTTVPVSAAPDVVPVPVVSNTTEINLRELTSHESPQQLEAS